MKQLSNYVLCKYCSGCNRLEDENFFGINKCENFIGAEKWQKNLKNKFSKTKTDKTIMKEVKNFKMKELKGIDRIKNLMEIETDKQVIKVAEYLITREDMDEKYLNENKNLDKMWSYITERAREKAENGCAWIDDDIVYGWAIHYWDESEEDLKKENEANDKLPKKETKKSKKTSSEETDTQKEEVRAEQNENDIVFKWKGKPVTRKQFNSKEYLSW